MLTKRAEDEIPLPLCDSSIIKPVRVTPNKVLQEKVKHCNPIFPAAQLPSAHLCFPRAGAGRLLIWERNGQLEILIFISAEAQGWGRTLLLVPLSRGGKNPAKESTL